MKIERHSVYKAVNSERDYQDKKWAIQQEEVPGIDAFACYVQGYTNKLIEACSTTNDDELRLSCFRKIAALCVACMENHGAPHRE